MSHRFKNVDRTTPLLLPPDLRDWVGEDDLVHFVIQAVDKLPLGKFAVNRKGCGDEQYPPHMLLALLVYCYANGIFSSRRIERATHRDIAVRYLSANLHPDHDTICAFRRNNFDAIAAAFVEVLELAQELKLLHLGTVSLDGTHLKANAAKDQNITYERATKLRSELQADVKELLQQAEVADQQGQDGQKLPAEIARREKLLAKMEEACVRIEARAKARAATEQADYERKVAEREQRPGQKKGRPLKPPSQTPAPDDLINLTDPEAKLMRKNESEGYTQSYNAQAVVDVGGSQLIVGQRVSDLSNDANELAADVASIPASLGQPTKVLADCGFVDGQAFKHLAAERPGLQLYVSVRREDLQAERRYDFRPPEKIKPPKHLVDPALLAMAAKLATPEGKAIYRQRGRTVEPVFGIIKAVLGFRQFLLRGLRKVTGEWNLVCLAYNLKRLHRLGAGLKLTSAS
jgi:transposase